MGAGGVSGGPVSPQLAAAKAGEGRAEQARERIFTQGGASVTTIGKAQVDNLPEGNQTDFDRLVLQLPGVSQDSSASSDRTTVIASENRLTRFPGGSSSMP